MGIIDDGCFMNRSSLNNLMNIIVKLFIKTQKKKLPNLGQFNYEFVAFRHVHPRDYVKMKIDTQYCMNDLLRISVDASMNN